MVFWSLSSRLSVSFSLPDLSSLNSWLVSSRESNDLMLLQVVSRTVYRKPLLYRIYFLIIKICWAFSSSISKPPRSVTSKSRISLSVLPFWDINILRIVFSNYLLFLRLNLVRPSSNGMMLMMCLKWLIYSNFFDLSASSIIVSSWRRNQPMLESSITVSIYSLVSMFLLFLFSKSRCFRVFTISMILLKKAIHMKFKHDFMYWRSISISFNSLSCF